MSSVAGKVAFITGGSRGIGREIARELLASGAHVVITGTSDEHLAAAERDLAPAGDSDGVLAVRADVRDYDQVAAAIAAATSRFGGLDILINNAGIGTFGPVADMTAAEWHRVIETNLTGVFHCCHAALPALKARGGGWIINISSLASRNPFPNGAAYSASKAGLNAFSDALMQEVRYDGIRVACVLPGSVNTSFGNSPTGAKSEWALSPEDVARTVVDLLSHPVRSLPSRVEIRPAQPPRKA